MNSLRIVCRIVNVGVDTVCVDWTKEGQPIEGERAHLSLVPLRQGNESLWPDATIGEVALRDLRPEVVHGLTIGQELTIELAPRP